MKLTTMLFAAALAAWGQSYQGGIRGVVQDPGGAAVADAKVTLLNQATNNSRATLTNQQGEYVFTSIDPATYALQVEAPGFKRFEHRDVVIGTQQFLTLDPKMEVGAVSESIQVNAEVALIETSNASTGQEIDGQKLTDLPMLGRNPFMFSKIAQNVVPVGDPRFNRFQDQSGSSQISIAGGPVRGNNYLIDGIPITDFQNRAVIIPSIESTQEVKFQANTYDAEVGRTGGGIFNTLLKSGTNEIHGSVMGYTRQTDWLANSFFYNAAGIARPETPFYNYGGSLGGPVYIPHVYDGRNKTFFWMVWEGYRQHSPLSQALAVPTAAERIGDFSHTLSSTGKLQTIYDPLTTTADASGVVMRQPFAGNIIPSNRINPVGLALASYFPLPGSTPSRYGTNDFTGADVLNDRADEETFKVDHEMFPWWRINASYLHYRSREPGGNLIQSIPGNSGEYLLYRKVDATAVNSVLIPNPTTVVTLRFGFNRFPNLTDEISQGFDPARLGFPSSLVSQMQNLAFPNITMQNMVSMANAGAGQSVFYSRNFLAGAAKYVGRHSLKAGFDYRVIHVDFTDLGSTSGQYSFDDVFTRLDPNSASRSAGSGADVASMLLGYPTSGQIEASSKLYYFLHYYGAYFQDDFRLTSKLTLNMGLRYEWETGIAERNNHIAVGFDPKVASPLTTPGLAPAGGVMFAGVNGAPTTCCDPSKTKFSPRIGFAWAMDPKTTIRGGYGIFWAPNRYTSDATIAPGYTQYTPYVASNDNNLTPANSLSNPFPGGILQPAGNAAGLLTGVGSSVTVIDQNRNSERVQQFSFDVQRELPGHVALELGYVASRSAHLDPAPTGGGAVNIDQLAPSYLAQGSALLQTVANPFYGYGGTGVIGGATVSRLQLLRPFPQFSSVNLYLDSSHASYNSMVLKAQKRLSRGVTFVGTWTHARNMDSSFGNSSTYQTTKAAPQDYYTLAAEWSRANIDTPDRFAGAVTYELPFGKGKRFAQGRLGEYVLGGWQTNAIWTFQSGFPLAIYQNSNQNSIIGTGVQRPNAAGVPAATSGSLEDRLGGYINPAAFSLAPAFTFGNVSRTIPLHGPGQANWDLSLFKTFKVKERVNLQFRAEAINALNTPMFRNPNTAFGAGAFGTITSQANFPRLLQLGARIGW